MKIIELLKKYLLEKWWIPILIFGISFFLLINEYLLPNTNFSIYLFYISGLILIVSFVWQFFKGSKIIGILQLSILIIPVLIYGYIFYLIAMMFNKPVEKLTHQNIELLIEDKTNLELPCEYKILKNLIQHTEGALDSDYSLNLVIKYKNSDEKYITEQIVKSDFFNKAKTSNYADPIWTKINKKTNKGVWIRRGKGFEFIHCNNEKNKSEPFYFEIDTLTNKIELNLSHL